MDQVWSCRATYQNFRGHLSKEGTWFPPGHQSPMNFEWRPCELRVFTSQLWKRLAPQMTHLNWHSENQPFNYLHFSIQFHSDCWLCPLIFFHKMEVNQLITQLGQWLRAFRKCLWNRACRQFVVTESSYAFIITYYGSFYSVLKICLLGCSYVFSTFYMEMCNSAARSGNTRAPNLPR